MIDDIFHASLMIVTHVVYLYLVDFLVLSKLCCILVRLLLLQHLVGDFMLMQHNFTLVMTLIDHIRVLPICINVDTDNLIVIFGISVTIAWVSTSRVI